MSQFFSDVANFFNQIWDFFEQLFGWFKSVIDLIAKYTQILTAAVSALPAWLTIGFVALIAVCVIYVILNRGSGS